MRNITEIIFFKDIPLIDIKNTIFFNSNKERDYFFLKCKYYPTLTFDNILFNFIRDRQSIDLPIDYETVQGINYCTFISDFEKDTRYYAYVLEYEYINDT